VSGVVYSFKRSTLLLIYILNIVYMNNYYFFMIYCIYYLSIVKTHTVCLIPCTGGTLTIFIKVYRRGVPSKFQRKSTFTGVPSMKVRCRTLSKKEYLPDTLRCVLTLVNYSYSKVPYTVRYHN
jgi:hypothetical protein